MKTTIRILGGTGQWELINRIVDHCHPDNPLCSGEGTGYYYGYGPWPCLWHETLLRSGQIEYVPRQGGRLSNDPSDVEGYYTWWETDSITAITFESYVWEHILNTLKHNEGWDEDGSPCKDCVVAADALELANGMPVYTIDIGLKSMAGKL